tara:strand:- start:10090 stop:12852 length:2763 start_codon:yes stop_codon:yes gene_type:complete
MKDIRLLGVRQNNLKNINIDIPFGKFTVVCGPSGSGKSSLAFESLYAEGQRRYIESLSNYARQFLKTAPKPELDQVENIPPAIALQQKNQVKNSRSTVGTTTEIYDYLRLLYAKVGKAFCPKDATPIQSDNLNVATQKVMEQFLEKRIYILCPITKKHKKDFLKTLMQDGFVRLFDKENKEILPLEELKKLPKAPYYLLIDRLVLRQDDQGRLTDSLRTAYQSFQKYNLETYGQALVLSTENEELKLDESHSCSKCGYTMPKLSPALFSFSSPVGACEDCNGFGNTLDIDPDKVIPNKMLSLSKGAISVFNMPSTKWEKTQMRKYCKAHNIDLNTPWNLLKKSDREILWNGDDDFFGVKGFFEYLETKKYKMHVRIFLARYKSPFTCETCHGERLKPAAKNVKIKEKSITDISQYNLQSLYDFIQTIELSKAEAAIAEEVLKQLKSRLSFLIRVGVEYLSLDRQTRTLSGGEYQRIHLATQLGMGLSQVLYVLDEPTIGLHPRDNLRLIDILKELKELGNTLVVVEHDHDVINSADHIIEMGPGSGKNGGEILFEGERKKFLANKDSLTASFIQKDPKVKIQPPQKILPQDEDKYLFLGGCSGHNLKNIDVKIPLERLTVVTGVSGSGKSSLIGQTLYPLLARHLGVDYPPHLPCEDFSLPEEVKNVVMIDQSAAGKNSRSNPITYMGAFDEVRKIFASLKESKSRAYKPGTFSLNVEGGRCPKCKGEGVETIEMQFLDEVRILCEDCKGKRFKKEVLEIKFEGKSIHDILSMTVDEAINFFVSYPKIRKALRYLQEVGLGYIQLGQSSASLSGGETQRLKLAKEFSSSKHSGNIYILDEPTTGLHFREIDLLMKILFQLVDAGATVIVIEHNLDVIKQAHYIVDLGPEGGNDGGSVLFQGGLQKFIGNKSSHTAKFLTN